MSPNEASPGTNEIQAFYDEFTRSRMVEYRLHPPNKRIERAIERVLPLLLSDHRVLDVGCGIGIVAEEVARHVPAGFVLGVDLSPKNIWYARKTVRGSNLQFATLDVSSELESVRERLGGPADVILLIDVIEHIPESDRPELLRGLRAIASDRSWLVMTYPSPQYQRHLMANDPDELQIVDHVVELDAITTEASEAGYHLKHYSLEDVWKANQYCHVIFQTMDGLEDLRPPSREPSFARRIVRRALHELEKRVLVPWRRRRYVDDVFGR